MKKFYIQHHFTSLLIIALLATFITVLYFTEVVPAEANPALTATPLPVALTPSPTLIPTPAPGETTGIVLWGLVIVAIIFLGLFFSRRNFSRGK